MRCDGMGGQVDTVRAAGQRDIGTGVHEELSAVGIGQGQCLADEAAQLASGEILFPNLDAFDAGCQRAADVFQERIVAADRRSVM